MSFAPGRILLLLVVLIIAVLQPAGTTSALADHEANHRYVVKGAVTDREGNPWAGRTVTVTHPSQPSAKVPTNRRGEYSIQLHLHDSDLGSEVTVDVGGARPIVHVIDFDENDAESTRVGTANIVTDLAAPRLTLLQKSPIPVWIIALAAIITGLVVGSRALSKRQKAGLKRKNSGNVSKGKKKK